MDTTSRARAKQVRHIADAESCASMIEAGRDLGARMQERRAATYLQVPARVLALLAERGIYKARFQARRSSGYYQRDLDTFLARLIAKSPYMDAILADAHPAVSLAHALPSALAIARHRLDA